MIGERRATLLLLLIFCVSILVNMPEAIVVKAEPKTIVVPDDYFSIQVAINKASTGDVIFVKSGTYYNQSIVINKTLSLIGEDAETTIIEGLNISYKVQPPLSIVIQVLANEVTIKGFTITKALVGINANADGTQICGNIISDVTDGLKINGSFNNILENIIQPVVIGIELHGSSSSISGNNCHNGRGGIFVIGNINRIERNNITNSNFGIDIGNGSENIVSRNRVIGNIFGGISISTGVNNKISENQIENNGWGILIGEDPNLIAANNVVCHNNFINNTLQARTDLSGDEINYWDDGKEGNFWSNYNGIDNNGDGIGETPYIIDENNRDNYPLMELYTVPENYPLLPLSYAPFDYFPEPDSIDVPLDTNISISISRPPSIVNMSTSPEVAVKERIDEVIFYSGRYTFILSELLEPNTTYSVTIVFGDPGAPEGFAPTSKKTWKFTTANYSTSERERPLVSDPFSNLPSVIIGFITSKIGLLLLVITIAFAGSIVLLVLVLNHKRRIKNQGRKNQ